MLQHEPVGLQHFSLLLAQFVPQGRNLLLKQSDPLWFDTLRAHLGCSQLLNLGLELYIALREDGRHFLNQIKIHIHIHTEQSNIKLTPVTINIYIRQTAAQSPHEK